MPSTVTLTVTKGEKTGETYTYTEKERLVAGRNPDCQIVMLEETVSRYHCVIDIAIPSVMVRDFGSKNQTYHNGKAIGGRPTDMSAEEGRKLKFEPFKLDDGNRLGLGPDVELSVGIKNVPRCAGCACDLEKVEHENEEGQPLCPDCHVKTMPAKKCSMCYVVLQGDDISIGICAECRAKPAETVIAKVLRPARIIEPEQIDLSGYRKIGVLGKGGMGEVWQVQEIETGNMMALKTIIPIIAASSEKARLAFMREAKLHAQLDHPNVLRQLKFGVSHNVYCIVMDLCDGNVDNLVRRAGGRLKLKFATNIILQALDGLIYAHAAEVTADLADGGKQVCHGIVHRDFKPQNLLYTSSGDNIRIRVSDFGLAKAFEISGQTGHTIAGEKAGSVPFMPRQQIIDYRDSKPEVDVWACAATYYYMLTGEYPKNINSHEQENVFREALQSKAVPIRQRDRSIPSKLAHVIDLALADNPEIKVKTAAELKRMILEAVS